jgi:hypothetical protein
MALVGCPEATGRWTSLDVLLVRTPGRCSPTIGDHVVVVVEATVVVVVVDGGGGAVVVVVDGGGGAVVVVVDGGFGVGFAEGGLVVVVTAGGLGFGADVPAGLAAEVVVVLVVNGNANGLAGVVVLVVLVVVELAGGDVVTGADLGLIPCSGLIVDGVCGEAWTTECEAATSEGPPPTPNRTTPRATSATVAAAHRWTAGWRAWATAQRHRRRARPAGGGTFPR